MDPSGLLPPSEPQFQHLHSHAKAASLDVDQGFCTRLWGPLHTESSIINKQVLIESPASCRLARGNVHEIRDRVCVPHHILSSQENLGHGRCSVAVLGRRWQDEGESPHLKVCFADGRY